MFDVVRRGYDPEQVRARVTELTTGADEQRRLATSLQKELETARAALDGARQGGTATDGFGSRVEKVLRLAEAEAAEVRERADAEANQSREQARADAEAYRHEVEQDLMTRVGKMDAEAARRSAALHQREQEVNERLEAAKAEAERIRAAATRNAEGEQARAKARIREMTEEAERSAQRSRGDATEEVNRLAGVRDGVRAEMAELHRVLGAQIHSRQSAQDTPTLTGDRDQDNSPEEASTPLLATRG